MGKNTFEDLKSKEKNWMLDHPIAHGIVSNAWIFFVCTLSAFVFGFGFNAFMDPGASLIDHTNNDAPLVLLKLVAGGVSGVSQVIVNFIELCGVKTIDQGGAFDEHLCISILYFVINIPLLILAWIGIGKKFAIYTAINVAEVSLFVAVLKVDIVPFVDYMAVFVNANGGLLARALFAGVLTGLSSALAFKVDISAGGIDIIAYYIALKKNTLVGKYSVMLNSITVVLFSITTAALSGWNLGDSSTAFGRIFYSLLYMLVGMFVVDTINVRNKKMKVEVVSSNKELGQMLISLVPHGATMTTGIGVYTGKERYVFTMVVSSYEVNDLVKAVRKEDPTSFVQVVQLSQVYGRFFMKPVK
jgi:uncharacterized membrane-anchored protein YitT (DUF2179 family)